MSEVGFRTFSVHTDLHNVRGHKTFFPKLTGGQVNRLQRFSIKKNGLLIFIKVFINYQIILVNDKTGCGNVI